MFPRKVTHFLLTASFQLILILSLLPVYQTYQPLLHAVLVEEIKAYQAQAQVQKIKFLQMERQALQAQIDLIDQDLVGLSTYQVRFWSDNFKGGVSRLDFVSANASLKNLENEVGTVLAQQEELAVQEEKRLMALVGELVKEGKDILADMGEMEGDLRGLNVGDLENLRRKEKLVTLRNLVVQATGIIKNRRIAMASAIKQIVIKKSELRLLMFENGEELYSMPISLGRRDYGTRAGEFAILDKLGTVWGVWRIYLPFWMGIYFAGSTENGIHGIPYDQAGNRYWTADIGVRNVTYGCVMPNDKNAQILYDWADIGTPVTIIN